MSLKSDTAQFKANEKRLEPREGSAKGTHFVVVTLMILLVLVGMYFTATHLHETEQQSATLNAPQSVDVPPAQ